jgi:hypothetical protein
VVRRTARTAWMTWTTSARKKALRQLVDRAERPDARRLVVVAVFVLFGFVVRTHVVSLVCHPWSLVEGSQHGSAKTMDGSAPAPFSL